MSGLNCMRSAVRHLSAIFVKKQIMQRKIALFFSLVLAFVTVGAQSVGSVPRPKLVVGIVVDQMRWDYLYRYHDQYGTDGFRRLLSDGYSLNNVHIDYVPTVTALGHTAIYTGSVPSIHGIAGNSWRDRETGESVYCTADNGVQPVGSTSTKNGSHSPNNLWSTTIGDQLRLATNFRSRVVGVSLKDRASILPAGKNPTAAFWFDDTTGNFITSSYYLKQLPAWVNSFNAQKNGETLLSKGWNTLYPIAQYTQSTADDVPWEGTVGTAKKAVFPYKNLPTDYVKDKGVIRATPFGNTLTLRFAEAALDGYQLGKNTDTDFLAINLASTDYVGHTFGPNSVEVQDTYLRLDRDLAAFFKMLDAKVGKGEYLVFLSADHGAAHSEGFLRENKLGGGFFDENMKADLEKALKARFGVEKLVMAISNYQVYLNKKTIRENRLTESEVKAEIIDALRGHPNVLYVTDMDKVNEASIPQPLRNRIVNGYNWKRSGQIQIITRDNMLPTYSKTGTTHSVWNSYDSHIPLVFMGWGVKPGASDKPYHMTDIAPTVAAMLKIEKPSGTVGNPIAEVSHP